MRRYGCNPFATWLSGESFCICCIKSGNKAKKRRAKQMRKSHVGGTLGYGFCCALFCGRQTIQQRRTINILKQWNNGMKCTNLWRIHHPRMQLKLGSPSLAKVTSEQWLLPSLRRREDEVKTAERAAALRRIPHNRITVVNKTDERTWDGSPADPSGWALDFSSEEINQGYP